MFLPMSWTSPLTVAIKIRPRVLCSCASLPFAEPLPAAAAAGLGLFGLHERGQVSDGLLHDPRALDDLGQEHLARAEQVADDVHAVHQAGLR